MAIEKNKTKYTILQMALRKHHHHKKTRFQGKDPQDGRTHHKGILSRSGRGHWTIPNKLKTYLLYC